MGLICILSSLGGVASSLNAVPPHLFLVSLKYLN
jgi:hypothetical protein